MGENRSEKGYLKIYCYGEFILGKNAKVDLSGKSYKGSSLNGDCCAAGGSYATLGGVGRCKNSLESQQPISYAQPSQTYGDIVLTSKNLRLGSSGEDIKI